MGWMPIGATPKEIEEIYSGVPWYIRHPFMAQKFQEEFENETDPERKERMHQCLESNTFNFTG